LGSKRSNRKSPPVKFPAKCQTRNDSQKKRIVKKRKTGKKERPEQKKKKKGTGGNMRLRTMMEQLSLSQRMYEGKKRKNRSQARFIPARKGEEKRKAGRKLWGVKGGKIGRGVKGSRAGWVVASGHFS